MDGILLINLGSPNSPYPKDVKPYLDQFLMDPYVIDVPYLLRLLLVKGIILNTRPKKSAKAYQRIWWEEGSPLLVLTQRFLKKFQQHFDIPVGVGMRYGNPSIQDAMQTLVDKGVKNLKVVPLYPQYAMASTKTVMTETVRVKEKLFPDLKITFTDPFYNNPNYINPFAKVIKEALSKHQVDHLLFSYHGIPERHVKKTDPTKQHCQINDQCCNTSNQEAHAVCYRHQCVVTTQLLAGQLGLDKDFYSIAYQSRLGSDPWLSPATDNVLEQLAKTHRRVAIVAPSFVTDCLETLDELGNEGREEFLEAGGEELVVIPCVNDQDDWVEGLKQICLACL